MSAQQNSALIPSIQKVCTIVNPIQLINSLLESLFEDKANSTGAKERFASKRRLASMPGFDFSLLRFESPVRPRIGILLTALDGWSYYEDLRWLREIYLK